MPHAAPATATPTRARSEALSAEQLAVDAIRRRAVEAAIWAMPIVSVDAMRQAFFRAGARYHDILYLSRPADWRLQITTPNASSLYVYFNFTLKDGPVVIEFPAAVGAGLFGSVLDAWQVPLADVGPEGEDHGNGAKYLLLPPGFRGDVAGGHVPVHSATYNGYAVFRAVPVTRSEDDTARALELVRQLRVYPRSEAANRPPSRLIDIAGQLFDGIARMDDTFFDALAKMVNEEPVQAQDLVAMGQLRSIGIEKGKSFRPDATLRAILRQAAREAQAVFMNATVNGLTPYWPNAKWGTPSYVATGARTGFTYQNGYLLNIDDRGAMFFLGCAAPKKLGATTMSLIGARDRSNARLDGDRAYRLRVPAHVPVKQFWAVAVYDLETAAFFRESPKIEVNSYEELQTNDDGSVDVFFGPKPPPGKSSNWIFTAPGKRWLAACRFSGPEHGIHDRSWTLGDIEPLK
jgi:hypothetical protein